MALKDIIGQERALEILRGCITKNRIAHAYLFAGEDGIGKKLTAINFAKTLNCLKAVTSYELRVISETPAPNSELQTPNSKPQTQIDCCDKCPSCIKINKSVHPDVFLIAPEDGQIKVDVIRRLAESLSYKVFEGRWKIAIIDKAETLNQSAANAFLKTLEEPPGESILILISSMPEIISGTIQSRCQRINFSPLPLKKIGELLKSNPPLPPFSKGGKGGFDPELRTPNSKLKLLSMLSGGRPGWALSESLIERRNRAFDGFKNLLSKVEEDLWDSNEAMEEWFEWVHLWLRDIAVFKATGKADLLINQDRKEEIQDISKNAELKDILKLSSILYNIKEFLRFNLNKQVILYHTHLLLKKTFGRTNA